MQKASLSEHELNSALDLVLERIKILSIQEYGAYAGEAKHISPDPDHWPFFAVALYKKCALWSSEKELKQQNEVCVYSTSDLLDLL